MTKKKSVRMVVCDLDGTLLNNASQISEHTKRVMQACRRQGILFGICSGRPIVGLKHKILDWQIEDDVDFVLGFNGGASWDLKSDQIETWMKLDKREITGIMDSFKGYPVIFAEYEGSNFLCTKRNLITAQFARRNHLHFIECKKQALIHDTSKLMVIGMPWVLNRYIKSHQMEQTGYRMFRSGPFLLEVVHPGLSKLVGVAGIAREHGIELDEVMTFGNDNNDLEMLAGTRGVAMKNALPIIKEAAGEMTDKNNQADGVADYLEKYVLHTKNIE